MLRYMLEDDIGRCMACVELVKDDFAGYEEEEFMQAIRKAIYNREGLIYDIDGTAAGMLTFSYSEKEILFLAVHPQYRKRGIASEMLGKVKSFFEEEEVIHVITFRKGDPKGIAARACYAACGFTEAEEVVVFDYPCQKLVCRVKRDL